MDKQNINDYKIQMCLLVLNGVECPYGKNCQLAHSYEELRCVNCHQEICSCIKISQKKVLLDKGIYPIEQILQEKSQSSTIRIHENQQNEKIIKVQESPGYQSESFQLQGRYSEVTGDFQRVDYQQIMAKRQKLQLKKQSSLNKKSKDISKPKKKIIQHKTHKKTSNQKRFGGLYEQRKMTQEKDQYQYLNKKKDYQDKQVIHQQSQEHPIWEESDDYKQISPYFMYNENNKCYTLAVQEEKGCEPNNHGLWSSVIDQQGDLDPPFNDKPAPLFISKIKDLLPELKKHMKSNIKGFNTQAEANFKHWKHQWKKHGCCMWVDMNEHQYFSKILELFKLAIKKGLLKLEAGKCIQTGESQLVFDMDFKFTVSNFKPAKEILHQNTIQEEQTFIRNNL